MKLQLNLQNFSTEVSSIYINACMIYTVVQTIGEDLCGITASLSEHWSDALSEHLGSDIKIGHYLDLILECSFTSHFLPFLGSFFMGCVTDSTLGMCRFFVFVPCCVQLLHHLSRMWNDLSCAPLPSVVTSHLRQWVTREYRWIFLFLSSLVQVVRVNSYFTHL